VNSRRVSRRERSRVLRFSTSAYVRAPNTGASRAWRLSIAIFSVYEFLYEPTPRTVAINEALEIARRFSTYEATQFINGILDAIKRDLDEQQPQEHVQPEEVEQPPDDESDETQED